MEGGGEEEGRRRGGGGSGVQRGEWIRRGNWPGVTKEQRLKQFLPKSKIVSERPCARAAGEHRLTLQNPHELVFSS